MGGEPRLKRAKTLDRSTDLISDLPRDIIDGIIMRHLPLRDAARMSVLSRKWKGIWTKTPHLNMDRHFYSTVIEDEYDDEYVAYLKIVSKILFQHDGPILGFSLYLPPTFRVDIISWISFVSTPDLRHFGLDNKGTSHIKLSSHIFSCKGLKNLELKYSIISLLGNFEGFPKLVNFDCDKVTFPEGAFHKIIHGCPLLQILKLTKCKGVDHISVGAAQDLRHLTVNGTFKSLHIGDARNLVSLSIGISKWLNFDHKSISEDFIRILGKSSKLERLCLGGQFCQLVFESPSTSICISTCISTKLRSLELSSIHLVDLVDFTSVVGALQRLPNIVTLNISVHTSKDMDVQALDYAPDLKLNYLRRADFAFSSASNSECKLIEILLACSPMLEILSLSFTRRIEDEWRVAEQLMRFRRESPKARIFCPEPP